MTDINLKFNNFKVFFKNLKKFEFNVKDKIEKFEYFIPKYYFGNKDEYITKYYKNKFIINKINKNNNFIKEILKFNKDDLNKEINMSTYSFNEKCIILNGNLGNNSSDLKKFTSNQVIYKNKDKNINLKFYENSKKNNVYDIYSIHKSFFENYKQPLYMLLINNEYNKNSKNKKYYLKLLNTQVSLINNIFLDNLLGSLSKKSIFEIIEKYNENNKNKNKNNNNKNNKVYKIYGNKLKLNNNSVEEKRKKFYYDINDMNSLYQDYNVSIELDNVNKMMKNNFNLFHGELKKIVKKQINNLYELLICSLDMETYFLNFLLYFNNSTELEKLYQLDNKVKLSIYKNIEIFRSYYDSYRSDLDKIMSDNNVFDPIDFDRFFDKELDNLLGYGDI